MAGREGRQWPGGQGDTCSPHPSPVTVSQGLPLPPEGDRLELYTGPAMASGGCKGKLG